MGWGMDRLLTAIDFIRGVGAVHSAIALSPLVNTLTTGTLELALAATTDCWNSWSLINTWKLFFLGSKWLYRWSWIWRTQWDQENWSVICKIRRIHMRNTWYASDLDQVYRPWYAKICRTVVRHIQVHLQKPERWLKPWHMVLIWEYSARALQWIPTWQNLVGVI